MGGAPPVPVSGRAPPPGPIDQPWEPVRQLVEVHGAALRVGDRAHALEASLLLGRAHLRAGTHRKALRIHLVLTCGPDDLGEVLGQALGELLAALQGTASAAADLERAREVGP